MSTELELLFEQNGGDEVTNGHSISALPALWRKLEVGEIIQVGDVLEFGNHGEPGHRFALAAGIIGGPAGSGLNVWRPLIPAASKQLSVKTTPSTVAKQPTYMLKAACPKTGYTVRVTQKWVSLHGSPLCPCCKESMPVAAMKAVAKEETIKKE